MRVKAARLRDPARSGWPAPVRFLFERWPMRDLFPYFRSGILAASEQYGPTASAPWPLFFWLAAPRQRIGLANGAKPK